MYNFLITYKNRELQIISASFLEFNGGWFSFYEQDIENELAEPVAFVNSEEVMSVAKEEVRNDV